MPSTLVLVVRENSKKCEKYYLHNLHKHNYITKYQARRNTPDRQPGRPVQFARLLSAVGCLSNDDSLTKHLILDAPDAITSLTFYATIVVNSCFLCVFSTCHPSMNKMDWSRSTPLFTCQVVMTSPGM